MKPVDSGTNEKLSKLLHGEKGIMRGQNAVCHFNNPVDWVKDKLPQYLTLVKQPMHLNKVKQLLKQDLDKSWGTKRYETVAHFAHDVRLVWKAAFIFNGGGKDGVKAFVFKFAKDLCKTFEKRLADVEHELEMSGPPCPLSIRCQAHRPGSEAGPSAARLPRSPLRLAPQLLLSDLRRNPLSEWFRKSDDWKAPRRQCAPTCAHAASSQPSS